ncbi:DUF4397 domain-containing protein [Halostagnicola sp. A-GB9-2]|uniref:DUF4397 domain-containing protein n=1 Tax=Halostagnicola sp. A-GB9-2 TaxID=3048066 RepID=UPI0031F32A18
MTTRRATLSAIGALGAGAALTGSALAVGEHEDDERAPDDETGDDEVPDGVSAVRVAHFSPDAPAVDIYLDGEQVLESVGYNDVTPYLEIEPGTAAVTITAAGDAEAVVFEDDVHFGQAFYTVAAIGELEADTFSPLILTDAGSALIRLAHASPDAPAVDVVGNDGSMDLFENVSFGMATNYVALPAGSYSLDVLPAANGAEEPDAGGEAPEYDGDGADETEHDVDQNGDGDHDKVMDDEDGTEDNYENDQVANGPDEAGEAVASVDVTLEQGGAYTAYAIGYLEPEANEEAFDVALTEDGPMALVEDDDPTDPAEPEPEDEAPEAADDDAEEYQDEPDAEAAPEDDAGPDEVTEPDNEYDGDNESANGNGPAGNETDY